MKEPILTTVPRDLYYHEVAYVRKLEDALKQIASYEISDNLNYYNARAMIELARSVIQ